MYKCPNCGAKLEENQCLYCGSNFKEHQEQQPFQDQTSENSTDQSSIHISTDELSEDINEFVNDILSKSLGKPNSKQWKQEYKQVDESIHIYFDLDEEEMMLPRKKKGITMFLCFFFGFLGFHYLYLNRNKMFLLYLFTVGLFGLGYIYDLIRIPFGYMRDGNGQYLA